MTRAVLLLCVALLMPAASAVGPDQDDAGTGTDASDDLEGAQWLLPGRYTGELVLPDDPYDYYKVALAPSEAIIADMTVDPDTLDWWGNPTHDYDLYLADADGTRLDHAIFRPTYHVEGTSELGYVFVSPGSRGASGPYELTISLVERPSVVVSDVTVTDRYLTTDEFGTPTGTRSSVSFVVENHGGAVRDGGLRVVAQSPMDTGAAPRVLHETGELLGPGELIEREITWDRTGQVGDFDVIVTYDARHEVDSGDNVATHRYSPAEEYGLQFAGVDVFNREVGLRLLPWPVGDEVSVQIQYRPAWKGIVVDHEADLVVVRPSTRVVAGMDGSGGLDVGPTTCLSVVILRPCVGVDA